MATSFAAQLAQIAKTSTHELDLRARRNLHAESLLFPREVAAKQDFDTIYAICLEGFQDLCQLDGRFAEFDRNLFSPQAKEQDREQMTRQENEALDVVIERFLCLLGGRILLNPALRTLEWLVRRFRVHVYNASSLILLSLPYHEMPIWRNILSIIPSNKLVAEWKWAAPYKGDSLNVPRHAIVHALTNYDGFWTRWNSYTISAAREGFQHATLLQFWNGVVVEAIIGRLSSARSGRREVQRQMMQDSLLKILPMLSDGFEIQNCPDLITALYTIVMVLAAKANLDDRVLDSLLQTVSASMKFDDGQTRSAIITLTTLVSQKQNRVMPRQSVDIFRNLNQLEEKLDSTAATYSIDALVEGLVAGSLPSMASKRGSVVSKMDFVGKLLRYLAKRQRHTAIKACLRSILIKISQQPLENDGNNPTRSNLSEILQGIYDEDKTSAVLIEAAKETGSDLEALESLIGSTLALKRAPATVTNDMMEVDERPTKEESLQQLIASTPSRTADTASFLAKFDSSLFDHLAQLFEVSCKKEQDITKFISLPIWSSATSGQLLLITLLLRFGVGNYAISLRTTALKLLARSIENISGADLQAIIPYALTALSEESSSSIRHAAAEVIIAIEKATSDVGTTDRVGSSELYDATGTEQVDWIPTSQVLNIIQQVFSPVIEDCILDASKVKDAVESALNGLSQNGLEGVKHGQTAVKKGLSKSFLDLLASHARATPILRVKLRIVTLLSDVQKVGNTTKTIALAPLLSEWISYDEAEAQTAAGTEGLIVDDIDSAMANLISSTTKDAPSDVLSVLQRDVASLRPPLAAAIFHRVQQVWGELKPHVMVSVALRLFELSFADSIQISAGAQEVLQNIALSTDAIGALLEQCLSSITQIQTEEQPRKRRRTSHGRESLPPDLAKAVDTATSQLTLSLELVEASYAQDRPELLAILFDILALLKRMKQQRMLSPYLLHLCLSGIHSIVIRQTALAKPTVDLSKIRADLVTDCIQTSESPQVQNTALLLSASLASLVPDSMLHQVMPLFTFMGQTLFAKEDDHSVHVIHQALNYIIPAVLNSLRRQNKDIIKSTSGILSSFAAAFDHIPQHRRVPIYQQLLNNMGNEDFAFILIAMLAVRTKFSRTFSTFLTDLMAELPTFSQLITYRNLLDLAADVTSSQPTAAAKVFDIGESAISQEEREDIRLAILETALQISLSQSLTTAMKKLHKLGDEKRAVLREQITSSLRQTLLIIQNDKDMNDDIDVGKRVLDALLNLPPLSELLSLTPDILQEMGADADHLKPQVLRVIATQLGGNPPKDVRTRVAAIDLLGKLTDMLVDGNDIPMVQAEIVAIDRISEVYGRKDLDAVLAATIAVSRDVCLKSDNSRIKTMSLLCLASMVELLKEASAPVVTDMVHKTIDMFKGVIEQQDEPVYIALNSLVAAIASHVSFLVSDQDVHDLIVSCIGSATTYTSASATESRTSALNTIASNMDLETLLGALFKAASSDTENQNATFKLESLNVLVTAIEGASKAHVIQNASLASQLILAHLDYRRRCARDPNSNANISRVENKINDISIQYVYKLNDTTFRPVFEQWLEWANRAYDVAGAPDLKTAQRLRQTSLHSLLTHFFNTLKSIVTSYAGYVIGPASAILESTIAAFESEGKKPTLDLDQVNLYSSTLDMLRASFTHDADGFFATPSHFDSLGPSLVRQLHLASSKAYRNLVANQIIPTIVALATAITDTPAHHQALSRSLTNLRHAPSAAVRLASIRTLAALSNDDEVGDEFIANTIGVGSAAGGDGDGIGIARGGGSSAGELMIYVNEMLEDDDEDVEIEVRKWVQSVREKAGEDVFEV